MNSIATLLLASYLATVAYQGHSDDLWSAVKQDAPNFIPWLIALLVLVVVYQSRGYLGPGNALVAAVIIAAVIAMLLVSADGVKTALHDLGALLKK